MATTKSLQINQVSLIQPGFLGTYILNQATFELLLKLPRVLFSVLFYNLYCLNVNLN